MYNLISYSRIFLLCLLLGIPILSYAQESIVVSNDDFQIEEGMDSLLISVQEIMNTDTSSGLLAKESAILQLLITEYEDFYSLTKNLFLLDYNLDRKGDKTSKAILRFWMGYYMKSQKINTALNY